MPALFSPGASLAKYFANSSWNPFAYGPVASATPKMFSKRSSPGGDAGIVLAIVACIVVDIVGILFFLRWIISKHQAQYQKTAARWSVHRTLANRTFRSNTTAATHGQDLEMGATNPPALSDTTTPSQPPPSYHTRSLRSGARSGALAAGTMRTGTARGTTEKGTARNGTLRTGTIRTTMRTGAGRTGGQRSQASRSDRYRPSQTMSQYLESQARSASSSTSGSRRAGAPSAKEYYGSQVGSVGRD